MNEKNVKINADNAKRKISQKIDANKKIVIHLAVGTANETCFSNSFYKLSFLRKIIP